MAIVIFAGANLQQIAEGMQEQFPGCPTMGCSTAGEISEGAFTSDTVSAFALGSPAKAAMQPVENLTEFRYERGAEILDALCSDMDISRDELVAEPERFVLIILADGLSGMEEVLIASLLVHIPDVKLVGGSAGDNFVFQQTQVACRGTVYPHGAVVMLLEPGVTFRVFAGHHYSPTDQTVVVTSADPEKRLIHRIDGKPAHRFVAQTIGLTTEELAKVIADIPTAGFTTYGEFFGPLLLNHTLAGIIFDGSRDE